MPAPAAADSFAKGSEHGGEIDDVGADGIFRAVRFLWIVVSVGQDVEGLDAGDALLDADMEPAESVIVSAFAFRERVLPDACSKEQVQE